MMKIGMITCQEIRIDCIKGWSIRDQFMSYDFMQIEVAGKQIVSRCSVEQGAASRDQSTGSCCALMIQDGHHIAGHGMFINRIMFFSVNTSVDCVDQSITTTGLGKLEKCATQEPFSV